MNIVISILYSLRKLCHCIGTPFASAENALCIWTHFIYPVSPLITVCHMFTAW